jgi:succinate-acetate transporter protein
MATGQHAVPPADPRGRAVAHGAPGTPPGPVPSPVIPVGAGFADPAPLGLAGFAGTTFFLSVVNTNMLGASVQTIVLGLALFYGGLAQLLAGMWEFAKGNTFGAVAFSSFGAFWLSFWYLLNHLPEKAAAGDVLNGVGLYLLVWTIFTAYMTVGAMRVSAAVLAVFVFLTLTFLVLTIGWLTESVSDFEANSNVWIHLGGWLGIITALLAWYASFAAVTNATFKRVVLPTMPR